MLVVFENKINCKSVWMGGKVEEDVVEVKEEMESIGEDVCDVEVEIEFEIISKGFYWKLCVWGNFIVFLVVVKVVEFDDLIKVFIWRERVK